MTYNEFKQKVEKYRSVIINSLFQYRHKYRKKIIALFEKYPEYLSEYQEETKMITQILKKFGL